MWRPADDARVLLMAGSTSDYAIEPRGEYVFGLVAGQAMRSRRGRERRLVRPGQIVAWDPSGGHSGTAVGDRPWSSRLIVVEVAGLAAVAGDEDALLPGDITFSEPRITDARLAREFVALHRAFERPASRLERDERLAEWLRAIVESRCPRGRARTTSVRCGWRATTSPRTRWPTSASTSWLAPPGSASSA